MPVTLPTTPTLRTLLAHAELRLSLVAAAGPPDSGAPTADAFERPVRWVHSSDLIDPTPFLADDLVLLTTGSQFADHDERGAAAYVERLVRRGVIALGFGSGVHRVGPPEELVAACSRAGLALFEVPYDVPFIAVARTHAEAMAAHLYARRGWALDAQHALAVAALRSSGLDATLAELSRRLGCWVGLFDSSGAITQEHPAPLLSAGREVGTDAGAELTDRAGQVAAAVTELLARGSAASRTLDEGLTLFTFGRSGALRGVIAVADARLDSEARAVITSVIAMAGLALEQSQQIARARRRMHSQLLASLRTDDPTLARRVLGALPPSPVLVAAADTGRVDAISDWLERQRTVGGTVSFAGEDADGLTICVGATGRGLLDQIAERFSLRLGVSEPAEYGAFSQAHAQALIALRRTEAGSGAVDYRDAQSGGVLDALVTDDARTLARTRLAPLRKAPNGAELERTLQVWLEHDAHSEHTAAALGIHRHTLRTRLAQAADLLGLDLSSFPARAELWAALRAAAAD